LNACRVARSFGAALFCWMWVGVASAAERVVLVVHSGPRDGIARRLESELRAEGFDVVVVESDAPSDADTLERAAKSGGAIAAVTTQRTPGASGMDVWVTDRVTGKTSRRHVEGADSGDAQVLALRAVELLRASLLELNERHPPRGEVSPTLEIRTRTTQDAPPLETPSPPRLGLGAGVTLVAAPGGFPATLAPTGVFSVRATKMWLGELFVLFPSSATVSREQGSAAITQTLLLARVRARFGPEKATLSGHATAGAGVYLLGGRGYAAPQYQSTDVTVVGMAGTIGGGGRVALAAPLSLVVDVSAAVIGPRPVLAFGDRPVAHTGRPLVLATLELEATW